MRVSMSKGQKYSLALHLALLLFMIFGVPDFLHRKFDEQPVAISVDILPISKISNVKPHPQYEQPKKQPVAEKQTERKPKEETHQKAPPPPPKKEEVVKKEPEKPKETPIPVKKEPPKKEEKKKVEKKKEPEKPKEKKEDDPLESILKGVEKQAKAEESKHPTQQKTEPNQHKAVSDHYNAAQPLSFSEKDAIAQQLKQCWSPPAGAKDEGNLAVLLKITLNQDGSVGYVELAQDKSRYNSDPFFRAAADSAKRAVRECSPLKQLPEGKYESWREMELNFDPKDL